MYPFDLIVLIDDDPINNLINRRLINKLQLSPRIEEFLEAEQALVFLKTVPSVQHLLILVDINMPVMNGWDFLKEYAGHCLERNDSVVMLSSSIDFQDRQRAKEFPAVSGFIEKPLTFEKLKPLI
ncbi:Two-component response regulator [Lunatimonas lonarensis]|uniref:Two-component response regulator n=1 Tax=Lunatimonas lonarensis TaxID=1232681 RepID=R7ZP59_9BACT|nr:response regulator [Lunatimonas lonarensis]EON75809.1 Two-component response regulator [Lunatimonas lonarensis]